MLYIFHITYASSMPRSHISITLTGKKVTINGEDLIIAEVTLKFLAAYTYQFFYWELHIRQPIIDTPHPVAVPAAAHPVLSARIFLR